MRALLTIIALLIIAPSIYAQAPTKDIYVNESLKPMFERYNILSVPEGLKTCSYNAFLRHADKNDEGFSAGRETMMVCFPQFVDEIIFSDSGREMKEIILPYFEAICQDTNREYKKRINVEGYCKCLTRLYRDDTMPISKIISPNFVKTDEYQTMATMCITTNLN